MRMSEKGEGVRMTVRVPLKQYQRIQKLIEDGEFLNTSDFVRKAIDYYLRTRKR